MTALSQEEIVSSTKTVMQGLDTLKNEHHQILNSLLSSMKTIKKENGDTNLVEEKTHILQKALESIDLGLSEAQVGTFSVSLVLSILLTQRILLICNICSFSLTVCFLSVVECSISHRTLTVEIAVYIQ